MSSISNKNKAKDYLRIADALKDDVGRGILRIDPKIGRKRNLGTGDVIEIYNEYKDKRTAGLLYPGRPMDNGSNVIRLDSSLRRNLNASIDDWVTIRKIEAKLAQSVTFATSGSRYRIDTKSLAGLLENRIVTEGDLFSFYAMGQRFDFMIMKFTPQAEAVRIHTKTKVIVSERTIEELETVEKSRVTYEDIGGLDEEIRKIREMIELPMRHPELFKRAGIEPPKGVLLYGPPGTGKTLLARAVAYETEAHFLTISGPEIMSKFYGQSEENLRNVFEDAKKNAPSIIFIDELDSIAPKRGEITGEVERRVVAQLLSLMDGLQSRGEIIVIGATNRINDIDAALRRPGRFDREIVLGVPDRDGRYEILQIHTRGMPLFQNVDLEELADRTHGFVGADIEALAKEAAMLSLRRILPEIDMEKPIPAEILNKIQIKMEDFNQALTSIEPSALREVLISTPKETWDDVGGLEDAKQQLREIIEWPLKYPNLYKHMNSKPPNGVLLFGPPGTGKTLLARALAHESEVNFIAVKGPEFLSKWVGESEKAVRETFRKARMAAPCIIFFDEIDAIAGVRGRSIGSQVTEQVVSQLLTEMDGLEELRNVILVAATNRPDMLDPALLRAGRFGRHVQINLPDKETLVEIFKIHIKEKPIGDDVDINELANMLEGYTGADVAAIAEEATLLAIREAVLQKQLHDEEKEKIEGVKIEKKHFEQAIEKILKRADEHTKSYMKSKKETRPEESIYG